MRSIYPILEHLEKRPAMFLHNDVGINALNHFLAGFMCGGGQTYTKGLNYPDFGLFTDWLGGLLNYKYEWSSSNWSWMLSDKYKDDKKALVKFFDHLKQFQVSEPEVFVIQIGQSNIQHAMEQELNYLRYGVGPSKSYYTRLKKLDRIILFKLLPSKTLFSLLVSANNKLTDSRNSDMSDKFLRAKIEEQFGIDLSDIKAIDRSEGIAILKQFKVF